MKKFSLKMLLVLILGIGAISCGNKDDDIKVSGITISEKNLTMVIGQEKDLSVTVKPPNASNKSVLWRSKNTEIATVDKGKVKAISVGITKILVRSVDGSFSDSAVVEVIREAIKVTSITLNQKTATLTVGDSTKLTVTVNPENATNKNVVWKSSDEKVAKVKDGKVEAISAGKADITATLEDDSGIFDKAEIIVNNSTVAVKSVTISEKTATLTVGDVKEFTATINPEDATIKNVIWTSSNTTVATVENGKVTAIIAGTAEITVTTVDGAFTDKATITVNSAVIKATSVVLSEKTATLIVGATKTLTATVNPANVTDKSVTWKSSNTSIATVVDGKITAIAAGTAEITVTTVDGTFTDKATITVNNAIIAVKSVTISEKAATLLVGGTKEFTATINPENATNKNVTWKSSNTAIATVVNGKVTAVSAGKAEITVTTEDGAFTDKAEITVSNVVINVTSVVLSEKTATLVTGETKEFTATINPANATNKNVTWKSSNTSVATVVNGKVTAVSAGKTDITVTTEDGSFTDKATITVNNPVINVTSVVLSEKTATLIVGGTKVFTATINPANATNKAVTWKSSNVAVATVTNGTVTAVSAGTAEITVTTEDGAFTDKATITVNNPIINVTSVVLSEKTATLIVGGTKVFTATINPANATNKAVTWKSSNVTVATVTNGTVTAVSAGTAEITVTTEDGSFTDKATITVNNPIINVTSVVLSEKTATLVIGNTKVFTATINPANATNKAVTWKSSNVAVATVTNGTVTAVSAGTAEITVTTEDGAFTDKAIVTVNTPTIEVTSLVLNATSALLKVGEATTFTVTVHPVNATNKAVTWTSSNTAIATVNNNGAVIAVSEGVVDITVTASNGKTAKAKVTVFSIEGTYTGTVYSVDNGEETVLTPDVEAEITIISPTKARVVTEIDVPGIVKIPIDTQLTTTDQPDGSVTVQGELRVWVSIIPIQVKLDGVIKPDGTLDINIGTSVKMDFVLRASK